MLLVVGACFPIFLVAAFHGQSLGLGIAQGLLILTGVIIQWRIFRNFSFPFRAFSTIASYLLINFLSAVIIFRFWFR
jgi:hypothetical protein